MGHRGDTRDALDGSLWTVLGAGNGPPAFSPRNNALLGGDPESALSNQRLYRRMRIGTAQRELGATASDSWRLVTAFLVQNGLAAIAPRCFTTEPNFGTRMTTNCGDLGRLSRARLSMVRFLDHPGPIKLPLRRATRLRHERYEVLDVYKHTWLTRLHGGSNVT